METVKWNKRDNANASIRIFPIYRIETKISQNHCLSSITTKSQQLQLDEEVRFVVYSGEKKENNDNNKNLPAKKYREEAIVKIRKPLKTLLTS